MARAAKPPGPSGFAVIDKEAGWTSHDVVAKARGVLGTRKVGHSGTLDPDATGVLVLGVGKGTRLLRYITALGKCYTAEVVFGTETSTLDDSGDVTAEYDMGTIAPGAVAAAAVDLTGDIMQIPPMVSAIKIDGKRLHELAREGIEVERPPRPVTVHRFTTAPTDDPIVFRVEVECSSGTYVRTLAADLGTALGGGAHLRNLRRTAVGSFSESESAPVESPTMLPLAAGMRDYGAVVVSEEIAEAIGFGKVLDRSDFAGAGVEATAFADGLTGDGPWPLLSVTGELLAVYVAHKGTTVKPEVVVA